MGFRRRASKPDQTLISRRTQRRNLHTLIALVASSSAPRSSSNTTVILRRADHRPFPRPAAAGAAPVALRAPFAPPAAPFLPLDIACSSSPVASYTGSQITVQRNRGAGDREVDNYLSEAASSFRYGFDLACVSLCRCALEEALKHRLSESFGREFTEQTNLAAQIDAAVAWKKLDPKLQPKARDIRVSGNNCVHGHLSEEQAKRTALRVLKSCREIVQDIYTE